jgi:hypothetical protein
MRITDLFSEPVQSTVRNALEATALAQAFLHTYLARRRRSRHRAQDPHPAGGHEHGEGPEKLQRKEGPCGGRDAVAAASRHQGASAPRDTHAPLLSTLTRDPVLAKHRVTDSDTPKRDSADTACRGRDG